MWQLYSDEAISGSGEEKKKRGIKGKGKKKNMTTKFLSLMTLAIMAFFVLAAFTTSVSATGEDGIIPFEEGIPDFDAMAMDKDGDKDKWMHGYEIVAHRVSLTADPEEIPADGTSTSAITAQLQDRHGNDVFVEDVIINFRTTRGTLNSDSAVTNEYGTATVTLTSSTKHGTAVIKATSDSVLTPGTTRVKFTKVVSATGAHDVEVSGVTSNYRTVIALIANFFQR